MNRTEPGAVESPTYPRPTPPHDRRKRPFGLYMILILLTLQALIGVLLTTIFGVGFILAPDELLPAIAPELTGIIIAIVLLLITAVVAIGLWRYRPWGWYGMMLLLAYYMATDALGYFNGQPDYVSMLLNVAMVFYLNQHDVRDLFERSAVDQVKR